ncbi:MAG: hypothetical protein GF331_16180 [Chitinivibrionales bacterium]|nr:hypothetical protein [Chitinivibrionales bacterium]
MPAKPSLNLLAASFVAAGIILLLENLQVVTGISRLWPALLVVVGIGFMMLFFQRHRSDVALIWLGSFTLMVGAFFLYLSFTDWRRMATLWPLFLLIVAISFLVSSRYSSHQPIFASIAIVFGMLFASLYLVFGVSPSLWPFSLVAFGLSLLWINYADRLGGHSHEKDTNNVTDDSVR